MTAGRFAAGQPVIRLARRSLTTFAALSGLGLMLAACGGGGSGIRGLAGVVATATPGGLAAMSQPAKTPRPAASRQLFATNDGRTPLEWASLLVQSTAANDTSYDHNGSVAWQGVGGATKSLSHTDCSGLINALLTQSYGVSRTEFRAWLSTERPLAKDYYTAILGQRGFSSVPAVSDIKPGDLIAVRYTNSAPGDDTGHVMLVAEAPKSRPASNPLEPNLQQWDVTVIDSADSGHGPADTRALGAGKSRAGLGRGVLRLYVDNAGHLAGYAWSDLSDSQFFAAGERPIVVGRIDPGFRT